MSETNPSQAHSVLSDRARCLLCAALGVALAFTWQCLTVRYNFGGQWTGLFCTGERWPAPPALKSEQIKVFPGSAGYDGQFYHYVAHDPLLRRGFDTYADNASVRWRRVLIPGTAYLLAFGQERWIDVFYFIAELGFLFVGIYWSASFCQRHGITPIWGLGFALVPAVMMSIERMTIDVALVALAVGLALHGEAGRPKELYALLVLAPLARETGVLLVCGYVLSLLRHGAWKKALVFSTAALPWLAWVLYVHLHTTDMPVAWLGPVPFLGLWEGTQAAVAKPASSGDGMFALVVHGLAAAGMWLALGTTGFLFWSRRARLGPVEWAAALFALLAVFVANPEVWADSSAYGRVMSPLLVWLALAGVASRQTWMAAPLAMVIPRVAAQLATHGPGIWRGMGG